MFTEWKAGGWDAVIVKKTADLIEQIRVLNRRVERESDEKVRNLNAMEFWKKEAIKLGWSNHVISPLDKNTA
jgi:hypothetical protein